MMGSKVRFVAFLAASVVVAGCAAAGPAGDGLATPKVAAPEAVNVPPVIVGAGMSTVPGEPFLDGPAAAATAVSAPLHGVSCLGSTLAGGLFYALFFPGDFSEDFKAWIGQKCAGPYMVTPAELARVPAPFPVRAMRTPRMGTLPVEEAVRRPAPAR